MNRRMEKTVCFSILLMASLGADAQTIIDEFDANQGPFTFGPDESITSEDAVLQDPSVLGDYRIFIPLLGNAPPGATVTSGVANGQWRCLLDSLGDGDGGCGSAYDRGCDALGFDFSSVGNFLFDVEAIDGASRLSVWASDINGGGAFFLLDRLSPGVMNLPRSLFLPATPGQLIDWQQITSLGFVISNEPGAGSRMDVIVNGISADAAVEFTGNPEDCETDVLFADGFE